MDSDLLDLYECRHCTSLVAHEFGADSPAEHADAAGDREDPRSPGDHKRCCDQCCYGEQRCTADRTR